MLGPEEIVTNHRSSTDTIFAPATPNLPAAIGIMRISGSHAHSALKHLKAFPVPKHRYFAVRKIHSPRSGEPLDEAGILLFDGPTSYTGEDMVEIHHHGSPAISGELLQGLSGLSGFRIADPGEFTRRALLNGKIDLVAAEAVADMANARVLGQVRASVPALTGGLEAKLMDWRRQLTTAMALIEAEIDFSAEEEVDEGASKVAFLSLEGLLQELRTAVQAAVAASKARRGLVVVLHGRPNVGKSSLLNRIAGRNVAIVTPEAGTTRDSLEVHVDLDGQAVTFVDTAGLRDGQSSAERLGVERTQAWLDRCDLAVFVGDDPREFEPTPTAGLLRVLNKVDVMEGRAIASVARDVLPVSAHLDIGIDQLLRHVSDRLAGMIGEATYALVNNERQLVCVREAIASLSRIVEIRDLTLDLQAEEVRTALGAIGKISEVSRSDEVLDEIFAGFCIGK